MTDTTAGSDPLRRRAEDLWEAIGGDLCICQRPEVPHWCESCQRRIQIIAEALRGPADAGIGPALSEPVPIPEPVTRASEIVDWLRQGDCIWPNDRERAIAILTGKFAAEETTSAIGKQLAALPVQAPPICGGCEQPMQKVEYRCGSCGIYVE